jgi:hypothetical protein
MTGTLAVKEPVDIARLRTLWPPNSQYGAEDMNACLDEIERLRAALEVGAKALALGCADPARTAEMLLKVRGGA